MMLNQSVPHVIDVYYGYNNGVTSWYRVWSDGWCEQGASASSEIVQETTINLLKSYNTTDYFLGGVGFVISNVGRQTITAKTTSSFTVSHDTDYPPAGTYSWWTAGYINL